MKTLHLVSIFCAVFFFISSCEKDDLVITPEFNLNESFEVKYDELLTLSSDDLKITVVEVMEDSRCPEFVLCAWAGLVRLKLEMIFEGVKSTEEIILNEVEHLKIGTYSIQLTKVTPETQIDVDMIELEDYVFTFFITEQ